MAFATINKGSSYFNTRLYTGNGSARSITGVGFQPDWVWVKPRSAVNSHVLADVIRGVTKTLATDLTAVEGTNVNAFTAFGTDGFSLGTGTDVNSNTVTYASWNWLAGGTGVSNTDGTITSTVSANTTSGFSIVSYTGNGTGGATIGHGLGAVPKMMIVKNRTSVAAWRIYHASLGNTQGMAFDTAVPTVSAVFWNNTSPTSTLFTVGTGSTVNTSASTYIAYCFAEVKGYSKFGSYTGNGSTDGTFVYTGFKPAFVMLKSSSSGAVGWITHDNKRIGFNPNNYYVEPNNSNAESADTDKILLLSNGFKLISTSASWNSSGGTYIYMAFAENPFVLTDGTPVTAR
jgi:hypothetical protein